jgi:hypothetical protein
MEKLSFWNTFCKATIIRIPKPCKKMTKGKPQATTLDEHDANIFYKTSRSSSTTYQKYY